MTTPLVVMLDLDGVAADFNYGLASTLLSTRSTDFDAALTSLDAGAAWTAVFDMPDAKVWDVIDGYGDQWWVDLPEVADRFPNCPRLLRLYDYADEVADRVSILTALPYSSNCATAAAHAASGKIRWVRHRLGSSFDNIVLCRRADKELLSAAGRVLVDDYAANCKSWVTAGGGAIHFSSLAPTAPLTRAAIQDALRRASLRNKTVTIL